MTEIVDILYILTVYLNIIHILLLTEVNSSLQDELVFGQRAWRPSCSGESLRKPGQHPLPAGKLRRSDQVSSSGEKLKMFSSIKLTLRAHGCQDIDCVVTPEQISDLALTEQQPNFALNPRSFTPQLFSNFGTPTRWEKRYESRDTVQSTPPKKKQKTKNKTKKEKKSFHLSLFTQMMSHKCY